MTSPRVSFLCLSSMFEVKVVATHEYSDTSFISYLLLDDPRNPAVIADNVGDNVGDVAGMGADLFESFVRIYFSFTFTVCHVFLSTNISHSAVTLVSPFYFSQVGSMIAAITLAEGDVALVLLPLWISGAGIVASIVGYFFVGTKDGATQRDLMMALHKGVLVSSFLVVGFSALICHFVFQDRATYGWKVFGCICIGLLAGVLIGCCFQIILVNINYDEDYTHSRFCCCYSRLPNTLRATRSGRSSR
jgi:Na+/H+-translocating membrane pyrophosphatase